MPNYSNVSGVWRDIDKNYSSVNGVWREIDKSYCNVDGVWRETYSSFIPILTYEYVGQCGASHLTGLDLGIYMYTKNHTSADRGWKKIFMVDDVFTFDRIQYSYYDCNAVFELGIDNESGGAIVPINLDREPGASNQTISFARRTGKPTFFANDRGYYHMARFDEFMLFDGGTLVYHYERYKYNTERPK